MCHQHQSRSTQAVTKRKTRRNPGANRANSSTTKTYFVTPESVRPLPKMTKKSQKRKWKGREKSRIYTDTSEKDRIEELARVTEQNRITNEQRQCVK